MHLPTVPDQNVHVKSFRVPSVSSPYKVNETIKSNWLGGDGPVWQLPAVQTPAVGIDVEALDGHVLVAGERAGSVQASATRRGRAVVHGVRHGCHRLPAVQRVVVAFGAVRGHHEQLTLHHARTVVLARPQHGRNLRPLVHARVVAPHFVVES